MQWFVRWMDTLSRWMGLGAAWALFVACLISAGAAAARYAFSIGSNAWLEVQWYLFGMAVFLGAPLLLRLNEHVRVDVIYGSRQPRTKAWIDTLGLSLVLIPLCLIIAWLAWPYAWDAYVQHEMSPSAGGLIRWPIKLAIPAGFFMLALQGLAELIRRIHYLRGQADLDLHYERPQQ
ncbi:MAG: TRAP transporter small permease subunit [Aquabacterium sp.]|jgi:TRAP-type mannitol/chloroaromatic compound transport system permease small subunit